MSLALESRHCGSVYVVRCAGRIIAGQESALLEEALKRGLRGFTGLVLNAGDGGDLRLAGPTPFVVKLLEITKLSAVFNIYPDEETAIISSLKEGAATSAESANTGPRVLFLDPSPDTCA